MRIYVAVGLLCAVGLFLGSRSPALAAPQSTQLAGCQVDVALGSNLIANGDAEQESGATTLTSVVTPSCWASASNLTAMAYTAPDNALPFPASGSGGGRTYFAGGPASTGQSTATLTQTVDLTPLQAVIEQGDVRASLGGWLGGYETQLDQMSLQVTFLDSSDTPLATLTLGPVTAAERGGATQLLARGTTGAVPPLARRAQIVLAATKLSPIGLYNDGYADDLWLLLYDSTPDCTTTVAANRNLIVAGDAERPGTAVNPAYTVPPPCWSSAGTITSARYGVTLLNDPGIPGGENDQQFLAGGPQTLTVGIAVTATQTIDLSSLADSIDSVTGMTARLSGNVSSDQIDQIQVAAQFLNAAGHPTGAALTIESNQPGDLNSSWYSRSAQADVPTDARSARVTLTASRPALDDSYSPQYINAYADTLRLVLTAGASAAGQLDPSFDTDGLVSVTFGHPNAYAYGVALQPDGKILVAGYTGTGAPQSGEDLYDLFSPGGNTAETSFALARLNPDGSLDTSFGSGGKVVTPFPAQQDGKVAALATDVAVQPDGRILLAGYAFEENVGSSVALARYLSNGALDTSFGEEGRILHRYAASCPADSRSYQLAQLPTGDYGLAGRGVPGGLYYAAVMRFSANGDSDSRFGANKDGIQIDQTVVGKDSQHYTVRYQEPDGKWWAAGYTGQGSQETLGLVRRYLNDGTPDSTFNDSGGFWIDRPLRDGETLRKDRTYALLPTSTGGFVVGGNAGGQLMLARYHPNLTPDLSFAGTGFYLASISPPIDAIQSMEPTIRQLHAYQDGRLLAILGSKPQYVTPETQTLFALTRLLPDGTLDLSFGQNGYGYANFGPYAEIALDSAPQSDHKVVVVGGRTTGEMSNGSAPLTQFAVARFLNNAPFSTAVEMPMLDKKLYLPLVERRQ